MLRTSTSEPKLEPRVARVSLVESVVTPAQKGCYLKAHIDCEGPIADDVLFEPHRDTLSALGVYTQESLLHNRDNGTLLQNYQGIAVHMEAGALLGQSGCSSLTIGC
jgi:hypothetical protein